MDGGRDEMSTTNLTRQERPWGVGEGGCPQIAMDRMQCAWNRTALAEAQCCNESCQRSQKQLRSFERFRYATRARPARLTERVTTD